MEALSDNNQRLPINRKETEMNFAAYSATVHKVLVMVNAGMIGLLQLMNQQNSSVFKTHKPELICFCVFVLIYAVLRVGEALDISQRHGFVERLVGYTSHLFGGLAAIVLIYVVCAAFALILLFLWVLCLSTVVYKTFTELMIVSGANSHGAASAGQSPSV